MARKRCWSLLPAFLAAALVLLAAEEPETFVFTPAVEHAIGKRARDAFFEEQALTPEGQLAFRVSGIGRRLAEVVDRPHVDYQFYPNRIRQNTWNFYWGLGVSYSADISDDADPDLAGLGFRIPLGTSYEFDDESGDFFLLVAPFLVNDDVVFSWAIGIRFGI